MAYSTQAKDIIRKGGRLLKVATISKTFFNASTREDLDISDRVTSWGVCNQDSTKVTVDWTIPYLDMDVRNDDHKLTPDSSLSFWNTGLVVDPDDCVLTVNGWVVLSEVAKELIFSYYGKIQDVVPKYDGSLPIVTIETTMIQDQRLQQEFSKSDGDTIKYGDSTW